MEIYSTVSFARTYAQWGGRMANISELVTQLIAIRISRRDMSLDEIKHEIAEIGAALSATDGVVERPVIEPSQEPIVQEEPEQPAPKPINMAEVFGYDTVTCLECGKSFLSLKRHLSLMHNMTDKEYRKKYSIPTKQKLVAQKVSESARKKATDRDQGAVLTEARVAKSQK